MSYKFGDVCLGECNGTQFFAVMYTTRADGTTSIFIPVTMKSPMSTRHRCEVYHGIPSGVTLQKIGYIPEQSTASTIGISYELVDEVLAEMNKTGTHPIVAFDVLEGSFTARRKRRAHDKDTTRTSD